MAEAYEAYRAGRLDAFYAPLVVDDEALDVGLADGTYAIDTRLRDTLRSLGFGGADESTARDGARLALGGRGGGALRGGVHVARRGRPRRLVRRPDRRPRGSARPARAEPGRARAPPRGKPALVSERMARLLAFVPTRKAALVLFALALCVFWFQALGWPMAKGRDTWDYLVYYLQFFDSKPPLSQVQLFRDPAHAARRRAADGPRRERPPRDRLRGAVRRLGPRVERDGAHLRASPGARLRIAAPRLSRLGDPLSPGVERRRLRHGALALGARRSRGPCNGRRRPGSSSSAWGSRRSC